jgi:hypothetical protein
VGCELMYLRVVVEAVEVIPAVCEYSMSIVYEYSISVKAVKVVPFLRNDVLPTACGQISLRLAKRVNFLLVMRRVLGPKPAANTCSV